MKRLFRLAVLPLTTLAICWPAQALIINIPADQPTIQAGIDEAVAGDTVLVADGTYVENIDFLGKAITVTSVNGPASTTIDGGGLSHVVTFQSFEGRDSLLEGFTITNGEPGIYCRGTFPGNQTGPTIRGNTIIGNAGWNNGGGIFCIYSGALIEQNSITGNSANWGGGIYSSYSDLSIRLNTISGNSATSSSGGGIYLSSCSGVIERNTISENDAFLFGGGLHMSKRFGPNPPPLVVDNLFSGNTVMYDGGGLYMDASTDAEVRGNVIVGNEAGDQGGGIFAIYGQSWFLSNNQITGNSANEGGGLFANQGSIYISNNLVADNTAQWKGGGFRLAGCSCTMLNNTIVNNQAIDSHGGGIHMFNSVLDMTNNILYFNSAQFSNGKEIFGASCDMRYCDVEGGQASLEPDATTWGPGMIDADPLFVAGPHSTYCLSHVATGQAENSPCRDAGGDYAMDTVFDTGLGQLTMNQMSTRTDQLADTLLVDLGWHYRGWPQNTVAAWMSGTPESETLPFQVQFTAGLINRYLVQTRLLAVKVDVTLASGGHFTSWRAGYTKLDRGETFTRTWVQNFPALGTLVGVNQFDLTAVDITPAPFNQPPYPPSGDTATGSCTVTAAAP